MSVSYLRIQSLISSYINFYTPLISLSNFFNCNKIFKKIINKNLYSKFSKFSLHLHAVRNVYFVSAVIVQAFLIFANLLKFPYLLQSQENRMR